MSNKNTPYISVLKDEVLRRFLINSVRYRKEIVKLYDSGVGIEKISELFSGCGIVLKPHHVVDILRKEDDRRCFLDFFKVSLTLAVAVIVVMYLIIYYALYIHH